MGLRRGLLRRARTSRLRPRSRRSRRRRRRQRRAAPHGGTL